MQTLLTGQNMTATDVAKELGLTAARIRGMTTGELFQKGFKVEVADNGWRKYHRVGEYKDKKSEVSTNDTGDSLISAREMKTKLECEKLKKEIKDLEERRAIELQAKKEELQSVKKERYNEAERAGYERACNDLRTAVEEAGLWIRENLVMSIDQQEQWIELINRLHESTTYKEIN